MINIVCNRVKWCIHELCMQSKDLSPAPLRLSLLVELSLCPRGAVTRRMGQNLICFERR